MTLNSFHGKVIYGEAFYSPRYLLVKLHHMTSKIAKGSFQATKEPP